MTGKKMIDGVNYVFSSEGVLTDGRPPIGEPGWQVVGKARDAGRGPGGARGGRTAGRPAGLGQD